MVAKPGCEQFSLTALKLKKASVDVFKENSQSGVLKIRLTANIETGSKGEVNETNPGRLLLTVAIDGVDRQDPGSNTEPEKIFSIVATMLGTFLPKEGRTLTADRFNECYEWAAIQTYLPLREYVSFTLSQMGLQLTLPFSIPPMAKTNEVIAAE